MQSSVCAAPCAKVSHRVSGHAACPWRLYYTRYYTGAAISASQPTVAVYQDLLAIAFEQDLGFPPGSARQLTQAIPAPSSR